MAELSLAHSLAEVRIHCLSALARACSCVVAPSNTPARVAAIPAELARGCAPDRLREMRAMHDVLSGGVRAPAQAQRWFDRTGDVSCAAKAGGSL